MSKYTLEISNRSSALIANLENVFDVQPLLKYVLAHWDLIGLKIEVVKND